MKVDSVRTFFIYIGHTIANFAKTLASRVAELAKKIFGHHKTIDQIPTHTNLPGRVNVIEMPSESTGAAAVVAEKANILPNPTQSEPVVALIIPRVEAKANTPTSL